MSHTKVAFFTNSPIITAMNQYRVLGPLQESNIQLLQGLQDNHVDLRALDECDLVLFQRNFSSQFITYRSMVNIAKKLNKPVVMDLDDYLIGLYQNHPDRVGTFFGMELVSILYAIRDSDAITVSSPTLQKVIAQINPNVYVLPNYFDDKLWQIKQPRVIKQNDPIRIVYIGTPSHKLDVESIATPLLQIAKTYGNKVEFLFYGAKPPEQLEGLKNTLWVKPETYTFTEFIPLIQKIEGDIAIAPLLDNTFNRCKSSIKYFEYSALGMPGVYSDIDPYSNVINESVTGLLAGNQHEWFEKLCHLIDSTETRKQMTTAAQKDLRDHYLLSKNAHQWQEAYHQILAKGTQPEENKPLDNAFLGKIAEQMQEQIALQAKTFNQLNQSIGELNGQVSELDSLLSIEKHHNSNLRQTIGKHEENASSLNETIRNLNSNLAVEKQHTLNLTGNIEALNMQLDRVTNDNNNLQLEVVDYATSTSWKITRPFRKIVKYFRSGS